MSAVPLVIGGHRPPLQNLPRLAREFYQGNAVIHWTLTIAHRGKGWLNDAFHSRFREIMLHAAARFRVAQATRLCRPATRRTEGKQRVETNESAVFAR